MKTVVLSVLLLFSIASFASKTTSIATGNWNATSTWDNGVPGCFDTIVIASGHTVTLQQDEDLSNCGSPIYVIVSGTFNLNCWSLLGLISSGYDLLLPSGSAISIRSGGSVTGCNGGGSWSNLPATITAGGNTIYDSDNDNTVSGPDYIGEPGTSLPVELLSFVSQVKNDRIELLWQTASEINSEYFEIERSTDGSNW